MTRCAGICYFHRRDRFCTIRLSEKLLQFRPRSDLIDTLLHEMIHAYLFVTNGNKGRDAHGEPFIAHMNRINSKAGTSITISHSFIREVDYFQTHVWKCNGPCANRPPYYGVVKRSTNRKPQPADFWWSAHLTSCGGTFIKISKPHAHASTSSNRCSGQYLGSKPYAGIPPSIAVIDDVKVHPYLAIKESARDSSAHRVNAVESDCSPNRVNLHTKRKLVIELADDEDQTCTNPKVATNGRALDNEGSAKSESSTASSDRRISKILRTGKGRTLGQAPNSQPPRWLQ